MKRRMIAMLLAVCLLVSMVPGMAVRTSAATNPYYEEYGIKYYQLFGTEYLKYISPDSENMIVGKMIDAYLAVLDDYGGIFDFLPSYIYAIREGGADILISEVLSQIGIGESLETKLMSDTTNLLVRQMCGNENLVVTVTNEVSGNFSKLKNNYDFATAVGKTQFVFDVKESCKALSDDAIDEIADKLFKESDKLLKRIGEGIELWQLFVSFIELQELQETVLQRLIELLPAERSDLDDELQKILNDMHKDIGLYVFEKYTTDKMLGWIKGAIKKSFFDGALAPNMLVAEIAEVFLKAATLVYTGATADDIYQTTCLSSYVSEISNALLDKQLEMKRSFLLSKTPIGGSDIADYEFLYSAYLAAIRVTLESALKTAKTDEKKDDVKFAMSLSDKYTYKTYIDFCMVDLNEAIAAGEQIELPQISGFPTATVKTETAASGTVTVTKDNANIMDRPCSTSTDILSVLLESGALGVEYAVTAKCENTRGNIWYKITTKSGQTGYIYSGNCTYAESSNTGNSNVGGSTIQAESASFVHRSDGVWLWPLPASNYAINDWAGCNGDNVCYFHNNTNHGGCAVAHETSTGLGHNGVDLAAYNTEVYASAAGYLYCTDTDWPSRGKTAIVEHPAGTDSNGTSWSYYTIYQHLSSAETSKNGRWVDAGERIAVSGATDGGSGYGQYHLHFGIVMGVSGQGQSFAQNPNGALYNLECQGWLTNPGYGNGRIMCNPALNSPAGTPTYYCGCEANTRAHAGSVLYTLNKSEVTIGEYTAQSCSHSYKTDETPATCTTAGTRVLTCTLCNDSYTETIPALGHDYQEKVVTATCSSYGYSIHTCSRCGYSYDTVPAEGDWSGWSDEKPKGVAEGLIQTRTEYKEITNSVEPSLEGWVQNGTATWTEYSDWGKWGITPIAKTDTTDVETATVWGYYYLLCPNCGAHMHGYGTCWTWAGGCGAPTYNTGWREIWSPTSWDSTGLKDWYGTGKYYTHIDGELVFQWTDNGSATTGYRSRTLEQIDGYEYYRWTDQEIDGAKERTVYRYYTGTLPEHSWKNGTCTVCGTADSDREEPAEPKPTEPSTPPCTNGHGYDERVAKEPTETSSGALTYTCIDCGYVETVELPPLNEESPYLKEIIAPSCTEKGYTIYRWSPVVYFESNFTEATGHIWDGGVVTVEPTVSSGGVKTYSCTACGEIKTESVPKTDHNHNFVYGSCLLCGAADPDWDYTDLITPIAYRKAGANRFDTAFLVADAMKEQLGVNKFDAIIVASGISFADALSGSYLAAVKNAPILLSFNTKYNNMAKDYIRENLTPGGTVYILGGTSAVPASMETGLEGFAVKRLAGTDRFGTNLEILKEAGVGDKPILVCTGLSFADSLSASAAEMPILLVWNKLTDDQKTFLKNSGGEFYIIGGESAVSAQMEAQLKDYGYVERIGGKNRFETSVRIAEEFFDDPDAVVLAYAWNFPDGLCGGALAAAMDAPLILTMDKYESQAAKYILGKTLPRRYVLGSKELISDEAIRAIFGPATDIR